MLHAGVCMDRQYCAFARIRHGQNTQDFFSELVRRRLATVYRCAHGRARIFHVHNRGLYAAIGEPDSRFRKPAPIARAVERLMVLDAVLARSDVTWLATEHEKLVHFTLLLSSRLNRDDLPHLTFVGGGSKTVRYFPDKLPIGVGADRQTHVFTYLVNRPAWTSGRSSTDTRSCCARCLVGRYDCSSRPILLIQSGCTKRRGARNWRVRCGYRQPTNCAGTSISGASSIKAQTDRTAMTRLDMRGHETHLEHPGTECCTASGSSTGPTS
jgi:hypothetical protein